MISVGTYVEEFDHKISNNGIKTRPDILTNSLRVHHACRIKDIANIIWFEHRVKKRAGEREREREIGSNYRCFIKKGDKVRYKTKLKKKPNVRSQCEQRNIRFIFHKKIGPMVASLTDSSDATEICSIDICRDHGKGLLGKNWYFTINCVSIL